MTWWFIQNTRTTRGAVSSGSALTRADDVRRRRRTTYDEWFRVVSGVLYRVRARVTTFA